MDFNKLVQRVKSLLMSPRTEWPVIATEPSTVPDLYKGYIVFVAAIPAICTFLGVSLLGAGLGAGGLGAGFGLGTAILTYIFSLIAVYVLALIIDALAPNFGGHKDRIQALKTAAYASTASWVAGIGALIPGFGFIIMLAGAIYSIYLLYLGLPHTMKAPQDRAAGYTAVVFIVAIILSWLMALLSGSIMGSAMMRAA